jgi:hypothetical protein
MPTDARREDRYTAHSAVAVDARDVDALATGYRTGSYVYGGGSFGYQGYHTNSYGFRGAHSPVSFELPLEASPGPGGDALLDRH